MPRIISASDLKHRLGEIVDEVYLGNCIGLPTETVYGLAADATNGQAVAGIFEMKGRPKFNPLILHVADLAMAGKYGEFNSLAKKLANTFWPGPLTLVVAKKHDSSLSDLVTAGLETIGIRCPDGPAQAIIAGCGRPLAAPSANRSGKVSPTSAEHVSSQFPNTDLLIVDNGACEVGLESTILKVEDNRLTLLRPGFVTAEMIKDATGITPQASTSNKIEAPGMMKSHYAPNAKVRMNCETCDDEDALLAFGSNLTAKNMFVLSARGDLREAAANLYQGLKVLDETGAKTICVSPIPEIGLGIAINDRLKRASAPRQDTQTTFAKSDLAKPMGNT